MCIGCEVCDLHEKTFVYSFFVGLLTIKYTYVGLCLIPSVGVFYHIYRSEESAENLGIRWAFLRRGKFKKVMTKTPKELLEEVRKERGRIISGYRKLN